MIEKFRRKFIRIAMLSVILVLGGMIVAIQLVNYWHVLENIDARMDILAQNHGTFGEIKGGRPPMGQISSKEQEPMSPQLPGFVGGGVYAETAFDTRYFTVTRTPQGETVSINVDHIAAVSRKEADAYADSLKNKAQEGFLGQYRFRVIRLEDGNAMYIFIDCYNALQGFYSFLRASLVVAAVSILLIFVMVVSFSKKAVRPMAESYEKQKRFITDASHELKTPLAIIRANTEVMELEAESEWTRSTKRQVERLSTLIEKMVLLSRMDEEGYRPETVEFSLSEMTQDVAESFAGMARTGGKDFRWECEPRIVINGNEAMLRQMCSLLLENAFKYSDEGGKICLTLSSSSRNASLLVENTVDNIEKGTHDELFERFYRRDASRNSRTGGHGVGLSVAQSIVNAHGGRIECFAPDEKRIVFKVTLVIPQAL